MRPIRPILAALSVVSFAFASGRAVPCENYETHMHQVNVLFQNNEARTLHVQGDRMWAGYYDYGFSVWDVSDPTSPALLGEAGTPWEHQYFEISGDVAYIVADGVFATYDVSNVAHPVPLETISLPGAARSVTVTSDWVVATTDGSIEVVDVSDPTAPVVVGSQAVGTSYWDGVADGNLVFFATESGLRVWDVTDPSLPALVGQPGLSTPIDRIEKEGDVVYTVRHTFGNTEIRTWDVSVPSSPAALGAIPAFGDGSILVVDGILYRYANQSSLSSLQAIDVTDPTYLVELGSFPICNNSPFSLASVGDYLLVWSIYDHSIRTFAIESPTVPQPSFEWASTERKLHSMDAAGDVIAWLEYYEVWNGYGYDGFTHVERWDVSDPDSPAPVVDFDIEGSYDTIRTDGSNLALASADDVYLSLPGSNPIAPVTGGRDALFDDGYLWVTRGSEGIVTVDLQDPTSILGTLATTGTVDGVARLGPVIAIGDDEEGLLVVARQPIAPSVLASNTAAGGLGEIAVEGDRLYARDPAGFVLHVFDVSDFLAPQLLSSTWSLRPGRGLAVRDGIVFAGGGCLMQVLDVTDGSAPVFVGAIPQGGRTALDVASSNDRVFIGSTTGPPNAMNTYVQIFAGPCAPATAVAVIASAGSHLVGSPNPFRQTTRFSFGVDREGRYDVSIFDVAGRRVRRIDTGLLPRGIHQLEWDGLGSSGRPVPAGVYFVRLDGSGNSEATRIVRLR